jgi:hypothetical protein
MSKSHSCLLQVMGGWQLHGFGTARYVGGVGNTVIAGGQQSRLLGSCRS